MDFHSRPLVVSLAVAMAATGVAAAEGNTALAGGTTWNDPAISWRVSREGDREIAEVVVNDNSVITGLAPAGGFTPAERAKIVAERLSAALSADARLGRRAGEGICVAVLNGCWVVSGARDGEPLIATADDATSSHHALHPSELAAMWANSIRLALGLGPAERVPAALPSRGPGTARTVPLASWGSVASWYGPGFHGRRTANGEVFDQQALTAAHRTLPFGTVLRVSLPSTGKSVVVRVNDRGPYIRGRSIDLSFGAAAALGMVERGLGKVKVEVLRIDT